MLPALLTLILLQQGGGETTPPSGDTVGYWQQRVSYRIVARLDERAQVVHGLAELWYVNQSPDTLRELYVHQHLNAFRPGSRWSATDVREHRVRFQNLRDPEYAYERFTARPVVDGTPMDVTYPLSPDSTVARIPLPHRLAPGDSLEVRFAWDARAPARVYRRNGRRGRRYDYAQWYPKVAVYDCYGWETNPLVPAGELYGEFGTYDVTLELAEDQVVGASGIAVEGDPGWERAKRSGEVFLQRDAYGPIPPAASLGEPPLSAGYKRVRFVGHRIHHFAWTTSPDYRYEGMMYEGRVALHALYPPEEASRWGNGRALRHTADALHWLESIYGPYQYPMVMSARRLESGATEFPMMVMYGGLSRGLVLHEVGHIYSYGFLANNEWRSAWMDEGLTDFQTMWAQGVTRPERADAVVPGHFTGPADVPMPRRGYESRAVTPSQAESEEVEATRLNFLGRAQPLGIPAAQYHEFGLYNFSVYSVGATMYGALRDVMGDSAFRAFLKGYYARWQFKHVDALAMRKEAERAYGGDLGWFFDQWLSSTGVIDYAITGRETTHDGDGWRTRVRVERRDNWEHPVPVGVRTANGWTLARADRSLQSQVLEIHTAGEPVEVRVDPGRLTEDWNSRNDVDGGWSLLDSRRTGWAFDWPLLDQADSRRTLALVGPEIWYGDPGGVTGAVRMRSNYDGWQDRREIGLAFTSRVPDGDASWVGRRVQGWLTWEDPQLFGSRPMVGLRAGAWALDGIGALQLRQRWDRSPFVYAAGPSSSITAALTATLPYDAAWFDPERWNDEKVVDASVAWSWRSKERAWRAARLLGVGGVIAGGPDAPSGGSLFGRAEAEGKLAQPIGGERTTLYLRGYGVLSDRAPLQRAAGLSALDATDTFERDLLRPAGGVFAREGVHYVAVGDAGLRGFSPLLRVNRALSSNAELGWEALTAKRASWRPVVTLSGFVDGAWANVFGGDTDLFGDAGVGVSAHGRLFDRSYTVRADFPIWVSKPSIAVGGATGDDAIRFRWTWSFDSLW